jgi:hypothetical protein
MTRTLAVLIGAVAAIALLAAPATAGDTAVVKPPALFEKNLPNVKTKSGIDVFLPSRLRVFTKASRVRPRAVARDGSYDLQLGIGRRCNGANVCFVASFTGTRGEEPALGRRVRLDDGHRGYWKDITCGASCSPAEIQWVENDVLYTIATKGVTEKNVKRTLVKLANSAINAGPR